MWRSVPAQSCEASVQNPGFELAGLPSFELPRSGSFELESFAAFELGKRVLARCTAAATRRIRAHNKGRTERTARPVRYRGPINGPV
jgi:hypothetical protein